MMPNATCYDCQRNTLHLETTHVSFAINPCRTILHYVDFFVQYFAI